MTYAMRQLLLCAIIIAGMVGLTVPVSAQGRTIRLGAAVTEVRDRLLVERLRSQIAERTGGKFSLSSPTDAPTPSPALLSALADRSIDMAIVAAPAARDVAGPALEALLHPLTYTNVREIRRAEDSEVGMVARISLEQRGLLLIDFWNVGLSRLAFNKPLSSLQDIQGKKVALLTQQGMSTQVLAQLGAQPVAVPSSDHYNALRAGAVDGVEVRSGVGLGTSPANPADQFTFTTVFDVPFRPSVFLVLASTSFWQGLNALEQSQLEAAVRAVAGVADGATTDTDGLFVNQQTDLGVRRITPTDQDLSRARAASYSAWGLGKDGLELQLLDRAIAASGRRSQLNTPTAPGMISKSVLFATDRKILNPSNADTGFDNVAGDLQFGELSVEMATTHGPIDDGNEKLKITVNAVSPDEAAFTAKLRAALNAATKKEVLMLVHGFNNSFGDAARRAAVFAANMHYPGIMVFYSWPSARSPFQYVHDLNSVSDTKAAFRHFMMVVAQSHPSSQTSVIAHSLGSRVVYDFLDFVQAAGSATKFRHLALAAPDIESDLFARYANVLVPMGGSFTTYISRSDRALYASETADKRPRLGRAEPAGIVVYPGMEPVDASDINAEDFMLHAYVFNKLQAVKDAAALFIDNKQASTRPGLEPASINGKSYWHMKP